MRDELYDRGYQAGRAELHAGIDRFVHAIAAGLNRLHREQWSAPWRKEARSKKTGLA